MSSQIEQIDAPFARRLKAERQKRGWSQARLAEQLDIETKTVSRWERGDSLPAAAQREKLCAIFEQSLQDLGLLDPPAPFLLDPMIPLLPSYHLIGREEEFASLKARLRTGGNVALSALNGLPGVGKTALSIALARDPELAAHFADGILWAGLGPSPNIQSHLNRWASLLGIAEGDLSRMKTLEDWSLAVHRAIGGRAMLLVIDDAWTVEAAMALKVGGATCAHVITTRFPPLAAQVAAQGATVLNELSTQEGLDLLQRLAPQVIELEPTSARELVEAVGGLPLALVLMGNYLRSQAYLGPSRRISSAVQRLRDAEARLIVQEARTPAERHPSRPYDEVVSLKTIISVTDQQLSPAARNALYTLSVFPAKPNSFSEDAALFVAACTSGTLDELMDAGLLQSGGADRYSLHQTIADYARLQLIGHAAQDRLVTYMTRFVDTHTMNYDLLDIEYSTILTTLNAAFDLSLADLARLCLSFTPFLLARSLYQLAELHLQRAYDSALTRGNEEEQITILLRLGQVLQRIGNFSRAEQHFQEGLSLARVYNTTDITMFLSDLGSLAWKQGKYAQCEAYLQEGLSLAREEQNQRYLYSLLMTSSSLALRRGNYTASEGAMREALALFRKSQAGEFDHAEMSVILCSLGIAVLGQGRSEEAESIFYEALNLAKSVNHSEWIATILNNLTEVYKVRGDYTQAEVHARRGLELARRIQHREWICVLALNCGEVARRLGQFEKAQRDLHEAIHLGKDLGIPQIVALGLSELGQIALLTGKIDQAENTFQEMKPFVPAEDRELLSWMFYDLALIARARGNLEEARQLGETAFTHRTITSEKQIAELLASVCESRNETGGFERKSRNF